jgi:hypothetical protein
VCGGVAPARRGRVGWPGSGRAGRCPPRCGGQEPGSRMTAPISRPWTGPGSARATGRTAQAGPPPRGSCTNRRRSQSASCRSHLRTARTPRPPGGGMTPPRTMRLGSPWVSSPPARSVLSGLGSSMPAGTRSSSPSGCGSGPRSSSTSPIIAWGPDWVAERNVETCTRRSNNSAASAHIRGALSDGESQ